MKKISNQEDARRKKKKMIGTALLAIGTILLLIGIVLMIYSQIHEYPRALFFSDAVRDMFWGMACSAHGIPLVVFGIFEIRKSTKE